MSGIDTSDIIALLRTERTDVRLQALQIAAQILDASFATELCEESVMESLLKCLDIKDLRIHAITLIINIIAEGGDVKAKQLIMEKVVDFLCSDCFGAEINLNLILLTNLTISEDMSEKFIEYCTQKKISQILIEKFLDYNPQGESEEVKADYSESDVWQHFASVLCNVCRLESGRRLFLLSLRTNNMANCLKQVRSKNAVRRRGVVGSIRSCLFDSNNHWWLVRDLNIIPVLLLPLVTATELTDKEKEGMDPILWMQGPDKQPDPEIDIQKMLLECLQLLGQKRAMREEMRKQKVYPICRNLDYLQEDEDISSIIYEIVNLTMGEEDPNTPLEPYNSIEDESVNHENSEHTTSAPHKCEEKNTDDDVDIHDDCSLDGVD